MCKDEGQREGSVQDGYGDFVVSGIVNQQSGNYSRLKDRLLEVGVPILVALLLVGPGMGPGALMNLDLIALPHMDVPESFLGVGTELPRQMPLWAFFSVLSKVIDGTLVVKAFLVSSIVLAWLGMKRWAAILGVRRPVDAAALYALSPFLLTRLGIGHLGLSLAVALLPWVAPVLLRPTNDLRRTFLYASILGVCGYQGGFLALIFVIVASLLDASSPRRKLDAFAVTFLAQVPWLVPSIFVILTTRFRPVSGAFFAVDTGSTPLGILSLSSGHGYWNQVFQVGDSGWIPTICGALLLGFAFKGSNAIPSDYRKSIVVVGVGSWFIAALSSISWFADLYGALTGNAASGLARDPHRLLVGHIFWVLPAACLGLDQLAQSARANMRVQQVTRVIPLAVVLMVSTPGVWGLDGNLDAQPIPSSWQDVREIIKSNPGTTVALPWALYLNQELPGGTNRRVLNPMKFFLSGDVITSSDTRLGFRNQESGDRREIVFEKALGGSANTATELSPTLDLLGVRWLVVQMTSPLARRYDFLVNDEGLELIVDAAEIRLFRVTSWPAESGGIKIVPRPQGILGGRLDQLGGSTARIAMPGADGWMVGTTRAEVSPEGLLYVPSTSGILWNPFQVATLVLFVMYIISICGVVLVIAKERSMSYPVLNQRSSK